MNAKPDLFNGLAWLKDKIGKIKKMQNQQLIENGKIFWLWNIPGLQYISPPITTYIQKMTQKSIASFFISNIAQ